MAKISLRFQQEEFELSVRNFLTSLQIQPKNISLFLQAFVHRSVLNETSGFYKESNERLEFLGDAILELMITEALFEDFPEKPEGQLTDIRSALVRGRNLAEVAASVGFESAIQLSRGEFVAAGHQNPYILANTVEAFIGALYLDQGIAAAKEWILKNIYSTLNHILERGLYVDPKSYLQEFTQEHWGVLPNYCLKSEEGEDHNKQYCIEVSLGEQKIGAGKGTSKKKGEQDAAENAISNKKKWEKCICLERKNKGA